MLFSCFFSLLQGIGGHWTWHMEDEPVRNHVLLLIVWAQSWGSKAKGTNLFAQLLTSQGKSLSDKMQLWQHWVLVSLVCFWWGWPRSKQGSPCSYGLGNTRLSPWQGNFEGNISQNNIHEDMGGFLKWWYSTTMVFPTKNDHFGVFWGYQHLRKHPYGE